MSSCRRWSSRPWRSCLLRREVGAPATVGIWRRRRRLVRTFYFVDKGVQRGVAYEYATAFEDWVNKRLEPGHPRVSVAVLPMPRDMLGAALTGGKVRSGDRPGHRQAGAAGARGLHQRHAHERERGGRERTRGPGCRSTTRRRRAAETATPASWCRGRSPLDAAHQPRVAVGVEESASGIAVPVMSNARRGPRRWSRHAPDAQTLLAVDAETSRRRTGTRGASRRRRRRPPGDRGAARRRAAWPPVAVWGVPAPRRRPRPPRSRRSAPWPAVGHLTDEFVRARIDRRIPAAGRARSSAAAPLAHRHRRHCVAARHQAGRSEGTSATRRLSVHDRTGWPRAARQLDGLGEQATQPGTRRAASPSRCGDMRAA